MESSAPWLIRLTLMLIIPQVMPGLLLCFVMRYDNYKKQAAVATDTEHSKITYFHCSLIGYIVGESLMQCLLFVANIHFLFEIQQPHDLTSSSLVQVNFIQDFPSYI